MDLTALVGQRPTRIRRVHFVSGGVADQANGPIELTLADGTVLLFDAAADGEALSIRPEPWTDPFREPLSEENRAYLATHGRWSAFEVAPTDTPLGTFIGQPIIAAIGHTTPAGNLTGLDLRLPPATLRIEAAYDELLVTVIPDA